MPKILSIKGANLASNFSCRNLRSSFVNGSVTTFRSVVGYDLCLSFLQPRGSIFATFSASSLEEVSSFSFKIFKLLRNVSFASYSAIICLAFSAFLAAASIEMLIICWHSSGVKRGASKIERVATLLLVEHKITKKTEKIPQAFKILMAPVGRDGCTSSTPSFGDSSTSFSPLFPPQSLRRLFDLLFFPTEITFTFLLSLISGESFSVVTLTAKTVLERANGTKKKNERATRTI
mmetsp:Transcript_59194/g.87929  ORF Transcript_59194/g.87929 Transcript_59194/m.87929 type:complete len:234 (-) Transcript_59194:151-852(-)